MAGLFPSTPDPESISANSPATSSEPTSSFSVKPLELTIEEIRDELARRELIEFTLRTYPEYKAGWFHRKVAAALDRFLDDLEARRSPRLILTAPPQHGKSELVSRRLPAIAFGRSPDLRIIGTSYSGDRAFDFSNDVQRIMDNDTYHGIFPDARIAGLYASIKDAKRTAALFEIAGRRGRYRAAGVGGGITGEPADLLIIDDPIKDFAEAISFTVRESTWNWLTSTAMSRLQEGGGVIVMATRWHMDDPIGRLLEKQRDRWTVINFAAIAEEDESNRKIGEPLSVERYSLESLLGIRDGGIMSAYQWAALYQQHPSPLGGGIFKRDDWRFYDVDAPREFDEIVQSWDCTFKETTDSDYVSGQVWGYKRADKFLIDRVNDRMNFRATKMAIRTMSASHPKAWRKFIEDKANGPAIIDDLKHEISGMIAVNPEGGKIARAHAVSGEVEAHNVYLPAKRKPETGALVPLPWVHAFIEQHAAFPSGSHDDDVDACTQALAQIRKLSLTLGVVDQGKQEKERVEAEIAKVKMSSMQKPAGNEETEACPQCQSRAIARIAGGKRCSQCGHQWSQTAPAAGLGIPSRGDLFK